MSLFALKDAACADLARQHGTPLFAYHGPTAARAYTDLRSALPDRVRLAYAVKANPHPELLRLFAGLGAGFDCASIGELDRVAELSPRPAPVLFAGPGKRHAEIARALSMGARIQAESVEDLEAVQALTNRRVAVNLRVHPATGVEERSPLIGGTGPSAFGIEEDDLQATVERARNLGHVEIRGLHVFAASNERDAERLLATWSLVLELGRRLSGMLPVPLEQIDLGGGLGIRYAADESPLDLALLGRGLRTLLEQHSWFSGELILEPGRFLAGPSGTYLVRVIRTKLSRGTRFVVLEGGINHLLRPLLTGQPFPVRAVQKCGEPYPATLAGPLCTSLDRLGQVLLPDLEPGDLLAFGCAGAYGFTEGMTHFLSHPPPPEIWIAS